MGAQGRVVVAIGPPAKQDDRLRAVGALAAGLAHDVNNLLTTVAGHARLLAADGEPSVRRRAEAILRAARDGGALLARLLQQARPRALALEPVSLARAAQEALELTRPRWSSARVSVRTDLAEAHVLADAAALGEVFVNLILNAVDAMPSGGTLALTVAHEGTTARATLSDTGCGIPAETLPRLFEPFYTTKGQGGTGLGLAMARHAVEAMGGAISVESKVGAGTCFLVELPACAPRPVALAPLSGLSRARFPRRVLVVEDDPDVRAVLVEMLGAAGHSVRAAATGDAGAAAFLAEGADVVVTDLSMPGLDGRALAAQVKLASPSTPVLMLTGWGESAEPGDGVDFVLAKPCDPQELIRRIDQL